MKSMQLTIYDNPENFLQRTEAGFQTAEAATGLIYGLARTLAIQPDYYGSPPFLATVGKGGDWLLAALRTPPYDMIVTINPLLSARDQAAHTEQALSVLVQGIAERQTDLSGVSGESALSGSFAAQWAARTGRQAIVERAMRVFKLVQVVQPDTPPGHFRPARGQEADRLTEWAYAFQAEALGENGPEHRVEVRKRMARFIAAEDIYVWETPRGEIVSCAAASRGTPNGRTVSLVYTPPEQRGRGYASAVVASLSRHLLGSGYAFCTLFTDLANPTSNHIYQAIGYRAVCDFTVYRFLADAQESTT